MESITEDFVSFEVAKLLKEKGCLWVELVWGPDNEGKPKGAFIGELNGGHDYKFNCYDENGDLIRPNKFNRKNTHYPRPTQALAMKWLRLKHRINIDVSVSDFPYDSSKTLWKTMIWAARKENDYKEPVLEDFESPEEAAEAAILYCLQKLI